MYRLMLKELRKKAGYRTQREFAETIGVKERKYASWEREEVALNLEDACMLARALNCTPNDLCGWESEETSRALTNDESRLLDRYRECTEARRESVMSAAADAVTLSKGERTPPPRSKFDTAEGM